MISKIFERAVNSQIVEFFDSHFHTFLSAFRKGYGCQTALLKVIEDWKKALDQNIREGKRIVICVVIKITIFYKIENIV
jgi:hypothetical protein